MQRADEPSETEVSIQETVSVLRTIPGGSEVIEWFHGWPHFGDAEILELRLLRKGESLLRLAAMTSAAGYCAGPPFKHAIFNFVLRDMIDVHLDGFGSPNVIGSLKLRANQAEPRHVHPSLLGIGLILGGVEIELEPCAGAFGIIRCSIEKITMTPVENYQRVN